MNKEKGKIVQSGMGGFLCPPGHPMHTCHVETDLRRRPENRGGMCLESAVECEWLNSATRAAVRMILQTWEQQKPLLDASEIQEWVLQVLGYFKGCYCRGDDSRKDDWHADNLVIGRKTSRPQPVDHHAGVHLIRKYYPDFTPTDAHFTGAYWGTKPQMKENQP